MSNPGYRKWPEACKVEGCEGSARGRHAAKGYCSRHDQQMRRAGRIIAVHPIQKRRDRSADEIMPGSDYDTKDLLNHAKSMIARHWGLPVWHHEYDESLSCACLALLSLARKWKIERGYPMGAFLETWGYSHLCRLRGPEFRWREHVELAGLNLSDSKGQQEPDETPDIASSVEQILAIAGEKYPRRAEFLRLYWIEGLTLDQIGDRHGITRERVRQIIVQATEAVRFRLRLSPGLTAGRKNNGRGAQGSTASLAAAWAKRIHGQHGGMYWRALYCAMLGDSSGRKGPARWKARHVAKVLKATDSDRIKAIRLGDWWVAEMQGKERPRPRLVAAA